MKFGNKMRSGIAGLAGIVLAGCATGPDGQTDGERIMDGLVNLASGPILRGNARLQRDSGKANSLYTAGEIVDNALYQHTQIKAAQALGDQINARANENVAYESPKRMTLQDINKGRTPYSTAFLKWVDDNGDGVGTPDELKSARRDWYLSGEGNIGFTTAIRNHKGEEVDCYIYNENGKLIVHKKEPITSEGYSPEVYIPIKELRESEPTRNSIVRWVINGEEIDSYYVDFIK